MLACQVCALPRPDGRTRGGHRWRPRRRLKSAPRSPAEGLEPGQERAGWSSTAALAALRSCLAVGLGCWSGRDPATARAVPGLGRSGAMPPVVVVPGAGPALSGWSPAVTLAAPVLGPGLVVIDLGGMLLVAAAPEPAPARVDPPLKIVWRFWLVKSWRGVRIARPLRGALPSLKITRARRSTAAGSVWLECGRRGPGLCRPSRSALLLGLVSVCPREAQTVAAARLLWRAVSGGRTAVKLEVRLQVDAPWCRPCARHRASGARRWQRWRGAGCTRFW